MFLSPREMRHSRLRTIMIVAIIALIAWLVFLLSGLANGLSNDNGATLRRMDAEGVALQEDVRFYMHRSILPMEIGDEIRAIDGVDDVTPIGHLTVTVLSEDERERIDATILGVDPEGFVVAEPSSGVSLANAPAGGNLVDSSFSRQGISIGDTITVTPSGEEMTVAGFVDGEKYNHLPVIYMPLGDWQALKYRTDAETGGIADPVSGFVVRGDDGVIGRINEQVVGVEAGSRQDAIEALPGYSAEMGTVRMILIILFLIASLVIAAFFYIITLQKTSQFGILKALGAQTRTLAVDLVGQVALLTVIGAVIGATLANIIAALIPATVPFYLDNSLVLGYSLVLVAVAIIGALFSAMRIAKVDPLLAIGRVD
jgi:putative ABC transport system permease protein